MPRSKKNNEPSFEQALEELETMVETMDSGQLPLEKLISNYERGAKLIAHCETVLDNARKRLDLLTLKPAASSNDTPSLPSTSQSADNDNTHHGDDDEIRLF
jgi:exodeoxyribonuclease VII small subunit